MIFRNSNDLYLAVDEILSQIPEERYPETIEVLNEDHHIFLDDVPELTEGELMSFAEKLMEADQTEALLPSVWRLLRAVFTDMMENGSDEAIAAAGTDLGSLYYTGRGGEQSYAKAVECYTVAEAHGSRQAGENLGYCYYYGRDVEVDYEKAFHFFAKGAFDGHLNSLYKIGDMYRNGYYVKKDPFEAFCIYSHCLDTLTDEAVPLVGADIMLRMGDCLFEGIGTAPDAEAALHFYQRAELLFYRKYKNGDPLIMDQLQHCINRQSEARVRIAAELPDYSWRNE